MNNDRADVIIPASEIYIQVMKNIGADEILVPKVGLKDGLMLTLYEKMVDGTVKDFQFLDSFWEYILSWWSQYHKENSWTTKPT